MPSCMATRRPQLQDNPMKILAFVLVVELWSPAGKFIESMETYGIWRDVRHCLWFSEILSTQGGGKYMHPVTAYCVPKYVDDTEEIY